jgi:hypothetical protein
MDMDVCEKVLAARERKVEEFGIEPSTAQLERQGLPAVPGDAMLLPMRKV